MRVRAETCGEGTLRVEVDQQHLAATFCQCRAQVNGGGGLTHAALLIHHRNNAGGTVAAQRSRVGVHAQGSTGGAEFLCLSFSQWFTFINEFEVLSLSVVYKVTSRAAVPRIGGVLSPLVGTRMRHPVNLHEPLGSDLGVHLRGRDGGVPQ